MSGPVGPTNDACITKNNTALPKRHDRVLKERKQKTSDLIFGLPQILTSNQNSHESDQPLNNSQIHQHSRMFCK